MDLKKTTVAERMAWLEHRGKKIFFSDYTNLAGTALVNQINTNNEYVVKNADQKNKDLFLLTDVSGSIIGASALKTLRNTVELLKPFVKASAVLGVTGIQKNILRFGNIGAPFQTRAFDTIEEAVEWLVKKAD